MATLTIRDFPDKERDRLRRQAVASGRSMEAEARRLILEGLAKPKQPKSDPKDWLIKVQALVAKSTKKHAHVAQTTRVAAEWPQNIQEESGTARRGFAEPAPRGKPLRRSKSVPKPIKKLSTNEAIARLQEFAAKATKNRKSKKLLSEEFLEERRAMWGED